MLVFPIDNGRAAPTRGVHPDPCRLGRCGPGSHQRRTSLRLRSIHHGRYRGEASVHQETVPAT